MSAPPRPGATGGFAAPDVSGQGGFAPPAGPPMSPEMQRVDQLRRTFQPRRFGSGYDRAAVDDLFEGILATLAGRAARPVGDSDLDAHRFNLVPGGYYEDEVDDALRQARDILRRR
jgi:DivIVA domain-containing protein